MSGLIHIRRALLSVSDKSGLPDFARALNHRGVELISTGGTSRILADAGLPVTPIDSVTGFPEIMHGRVKTLHPRVHGALLARRDDPSHAEAMREHDIRPIDLIAINLYPFERTVARPGVSPEDAVEQIDIGGPSMIRSAAKNHAFVTVATRAEHYAQIIENLEQNDGATTPDLRARLAAEAFARTAEYDSAIASWFAMQLHVAPDPLPETLSIRMHRAALLRYGENPHQSGALYRDAPSGTLDLVSAEQLHGQPLSYNNILDASAALLLAHDLARLRPADSAAVVVKHTNPCGAAVASTPRDAAHHAIEGDPVAAFGGILAVTRAIDLPCAERITQKGMFLEVILAPGYEPDALDQLRTRWKNVRILATRTPFDATLAPCSLRSVPGGVLVQQRDDALPDPSRWIHRAGPALDAARLSAAAVLWVACKHLLSNAIAIGGETGGALRLFGAGTGQMDRVTSCELAVRKAGALAHGAIAASDAFFPFPDGPERLINAGVAAILHPGGSKRDEETFSLCEARGVSCYTTGTRHFRH